MNSNADRLIHNLTPEIEQKCEELQAARKERNWSAVFVLLCAMAVLIPTLLVFAGVSLAVLIVPPVFMSMSVILLLPILLSGRTQNQGGNGYEQA